MTTKVKQGRPSTYGEVIADAICERIAESDYGLEEVCKTDESFPSVRTIFRWLDQHESFRHKYARAKELQGHTQAGRAVRDALNAKDAALGRLAYDARRWHAGKLNAKVYGDKVAHVGGDEGDAPIAHSLAVKFV